MSDENPIGGALYVRQGYRGRWRVEKAGRKWVTLRSLEVMGRGGYWSSIRVPREDWPDGWIRV